MVNVHQAENIRIISDSKISTDFVALDVFGADHDNNFCLIGKLVQHTELTVRLKSRQYTEA